MDAVLDATLGAALFIIHKLAFFFIYVAAVGVWVLLFVVVRCRWLFVVGGCCWLLLLVVAGCWSLVVVVGSCLSVVTACFFKT